MRTPQPMPSLEAVSDAELVAACAGGDRNAFGQIVERYQRLLCSLAYSATGQLSYSEDVAQETFVDAWRQLRDLREPEKLRPWLCGILRYKISRLRRADGKEPVRNAEALESARDMVSDDAPAADVTIQKEEQAIMWNALGSLPELYREPLILYYREHQSVEHVAVALDLSEDAVKQRLARGRKILQEQVLAFVEGALARTTPGRVFTVGVLALLPEFSVPAKAAGVSAAAAHGGGMVAKSMGFAAMFASITGVATTVMALRFSLDQARTSRERRAVVIATLACFFGSLAFIAVLYGLREGAFRWWDQREVFAIAAQVVVLTYVVAWPIAMIAMMRWFRNLRSSQRLQHPEKFQDARDQAGSAAGEYRSRAKLFGVPLFHFRFSSPDAGQDPVFGWIAGGDRAYGILFAWGGYAVGTISVGAFSVGFLSVGALSVGVISLGTFAVGLVALGTAAIGIKAFAWLSALGWKTAAGGGFAIAGEAAIGPVAFAQYANDTIARQLFASPQSEQNQQAVIFMVIAILSLVPMALYLRAVRQRLGKRT
jgi:RNA polymerase sigma factor (sigma-70 family)